VTESVNSTTETVTEALQPVTESVNSTTEAVTAALQPVTESVGSTTETVAAALQRVTESVNSTTETVTDALQPVTESVGSTTEAVANPLLETPDPTPGTLTEIAQPLGESVALPADRVPERIDGPVFEVPGLAPTEQPVEPAGAPDLVPLEGSVTDSLIAVDLSQTLPVLGAVGIAAATAVVIARGLSAPSTPLVFTNVRLIPCIASATAQHVTATTAAASSHVGSTVTRVIPPIVGGTVGSIADGFDRAVQGPRDESGDGLTDSRLLVQLGMLLGFAYLAFLTVWFWATRLRWPRNTV